MSTPIVAVTATTRLVDGMAKAMVNRAYTDAILDAGMIPLLVPPMTGESAPSILDAVQGLVLTGGEDIDPAYFGAERHPATGPANELRDECELALAREAARRGMPTLAICRGVQVLNVALGGTLVQDIPSEVSKTIQHQAKGERGQRVHDVAINPGSRLGQIVGSAAIRTNSFHHQSVERVAPGLEITATSSDGVIEAVECADRAWWAVGVQWHPEELTKTPEDWDRRLFSAFAESVKKS
ncbi:MAG TPA: gamma-glutamyl-gamma-aminobutyrate hydrolase family protein [Gemmatimonadaceae bacterium]|nr:gamma-glutamyl-gamma-aminobutyrate hydrolase family protein [Gemmatimonadaceae bacterium]